MLYDESLTEQLKKEWEFNGLFEDSLENHDFHVYLQPKVRLSDEKIKGAEALVRWIHPERGVIYPSDFIPLPKHNGEACRLDLYVFTEVHALVHDWIRQGRELIPVSVNLSRQHSTEEDCLNEFYHTAQEYGIPQGTIGFELTESIFFDNQQIDRVRDIIRQMRTPGFDCSLDDFGPGYSSLGLSKGSDVDTIKLSRSFFLNMTGSKARGVITCLVDLSKRLYVQMAAEGIETTKQVGYLRSIGCNMMQGYVLFKPLSTRKFEKLRFGHIQRASCIRCNICVWHESPFGKCVERPPDYARSRTGVGASTPRQTGSLKGVITYAHLSALRKPDETWGCPECC